MDKFKINMIGGGFQHAFGSSGWSTPELIEWDKKGGANISMHIDDAIMSPTNKSKKNYAWIAESSDYIAHIVDWAKNNIDQLENNFELIFTCDKRLIPLSNKMRLSIPNAVPWIENPQIHNKSKLISMIVSKKSYTSGHRYRLEILEKFKNQIDCYGAGHNFIEKKEQGLNDYYFSIAMENANYPNYFVEKITDCFATGTIPIFWGTPTIGEFFNENGIIFLTDDFKIEDLSIELYYSKMDAIKDNFDRAIKIPMAEDYIYDTYIK